MAALLSLRGYIERAAEASFSWADGRDCGLFAADWCVIATGRDPAASWRGRYASALQCARLTRAIGGFSGAFAFGALACGFPVTRTPEDGDVGLIEIPTGRRARPCGAIRFRGRWAFLTARGLMVSRGLPLMAWNVSQWRKPSNMSCKSPPMC